MIASKILASAREKENKARSKKITSIVHAILIVLLVIPLMNAVPSPEEKSQVVVLDFRDFKSASKKSSTKKATESNGTVPVKLPEQTAVEQNKETVPPPPTAKKKPVLVDDSSKTPIKTKPNVADKPSEVPPTPKVEEKVEKPVEKPSKKVKPVKVTPPTKTKTEAPAKPKGKGKDTVGKTSGQGTGKQGSSKDGDSNTDGVADKGKNGRDFSGDGIFNRRVTRRADVKKITTETGKIVINLCINPSGKVTFAEYNEELSTIDTKSVVRKAIRVAKDYRFERDYTAPKQQCGKLSFLFDIEEEN